MSGASSSANSTPKKESKKKPSTLAQNIKTVIRLGKCHCVNLSEESIPVPELEQRQQLEQVREEEPEESEAVTEAACIVQEKNFGFSKNFGSKYKLGDVVGKGSFGYTCAANFMNGELEGQKVAVKVISKEKMPGEIAYEDVKKEIKILKGLSGDSGHKNLVKFYDTFEDNDNVYIVMELCEGGELFSRFLSRGGKYTEDDAKAVLVQILDFVAFCHFQGVVHRDLKPENFLYASQDENSELKAIDFGLSYILKQDETLHDFVGSPHYVAPEVLNKSYSIEADIWSVGVIAYMLLCGTQPFRARTKTGIFRSVRRADPSFDDEPWTSRSPEARDFVKRLLTKDPRKRLTAAQALCHPWIRNYNDTKVPLDFLIFKFIEDYLHSSLLRQAALKAVSEALSLSPDALYYLREQFALLNPDDNGTINYDNIREAQRNNTKYALKEFQMCQYLRSVRVTLKSGRFDLDEFCAAAVSVHQLEALDDWEDHLRCAYELFDQEDNRAIVIEDIASELKLGPTVPLHSVFRDWIRDDDGKLSFLGFAKLLGCVSSRSFALAKAK